MPVSTSQSTTTPNSNAWAGWEIQVLHDLGAPASKLNIAFLDEWHQYEESNAKNNPLNITAPQGVGSINSAGVQSYATEQQGAQYTANVIRQYPTIYNMLKGDNVQSTLFNNSHLVALVKELNKWGSHSFANHLAGGESVATKTKNAVTAPFSAIDNFFQWVGGNWDRILFVMGGAIIIIIALIFVVNSAKKNTFSFERGDS